MKKRILLLFLFVSTFLYAQSYSVSITSPSNNSWITGSVIDNTKSNINVSFSYSGQKANTQNKWKFKIIKDAIVGLEGSSTYSEGWVYEGTSYFVIQADILLENLYKIKMYEEDYITKALTERAVSSSVYVYVKQAVTVANNFYGGLITVNGLARGNLSTFNLEAGEGLSLAAINNQTDTQGYTRIWNTSSTNPSRWTVNNEFVSYSSSYSYGATSSHNGYTIVDELRKICNITCSGPAYGGTTYYSSGVVPVVEDNSIQVTACNKVSSDYMNLVFQSWWDGSTQNPRSFTTSSHMSANINYTTTNPNNGYRNLSVSSTVGAPITLSWSEHPNSSVTTYYIYRKVKPSGGSVGPETLIGTRTRGNTTYTDNDYVVSNSPYYVLYYDVRAYYSPNSSYASTDYVEVLGQEGLQARIENSSNNKLMVTKEVPSEYSLNNYPNPFNPATTINYQLPSEGMVTLKVYDVIGKEIATLVDGHRAAGTYNIEFNASDLPSGIYIYRLSANNFTQSKKMLLVK